jgi:ArsR family transcriptional regulator
MSGTASADELELFRSHAEVLHVLSNPLRHEIVHRLAEAPRTVTELVMLTGASKSNVSQHLSLLRSHGLVDAARDGRSVTFSLAYPQLAEACRLIDEILLDQANRAARLHAPQSNEPADAG